MLSDLKVAAGSETPNYGQFVDRYGKETAGFLSFDELREIYLNHVHYADPLTVRLPPPEDNLLRCLCQAINGEQNGKISRDEFVNLLTK